MSEYCFQISEIAIASTELVSFSHTLNKMYLDIDIHAAADIHHKCESWEYLSMDLSQLSLRNIQDFPLCTKALWWPHNTF